MPIYKDIATLTTATTLSGSEEVPISNTTKTTFTKIKEWIVNSISSLITTNYIPKWDAANKRFVNSKIFDNGVNVGIGTNNPLSPLDITYTDSSFNAGVSVRNNSTSQYALPSINIKDDHGNAQAQFCYVTPFYANPALRNTVLFNSVYKGVHLGFVTSSGGGDDPNQSSSNMGDIYFQTGPSSANKHLFISGTTGFVGVGNTSPAEKLDVVGVIKSSAGFKKGSGDNTKALLDGGGSVLLTELLTRHNLNENIYGTLSAAPSDGNMSTPLASTINSVAGYNVINNSTFLYGLATHITFSLSLVYLINYMKIGLAYKLICRVVGTNYSKYLTIVDSIGGSQYELKNGQWFFCEFIRVDVSNVLILKFDVK